MPLYLVHRLLKLLVIEDGPELALAVHRPEGGLHLHLGLAHIGLALVCLVIFCPREPRLSPDPLTSCTVPLTNDIINVIINEHVLKCPLSHVSPEPEEG